MSKPISEYSLSEGGRGKTMTPNEILDNLRLVTKRYEKRVTSTGEVNISYMAEDAANCIENLLSETTALKAQCAELQEALDGEYGVLFWLERLHPMNPDEPCAVYTAWKKAKAMCPIRSTPTHRPTVYMIGEEGDTMETNNPNVVARFKEFGYKEYNKQEYKEQIRQQEHQGAKEAVREQRG